MLLCLIFLPNANAVNTRDVCTSYLCTSFCTIDMYCAVQNIPHSHDLATTLSWPEISRKVATAFPFGEIKNCIILFLTLLFQDLHCITFLSLYLLCVRACVPVRCGIMCDSAYVATDIPSFIIHFAYTSVWIVWDKRGYKPRTACKYLILKQARIKKTGYKKLFKRYFYRRILQSELEILRI